MKRRMWFPAISGFLLSPAAFMLSFLPPSSKLTWPAFLSPLHLPHSFYLLSFTSTTPCFSLCALCIFSLKQTVDALWEHALFRFDDNDTHKSLPCSKYLKSGIWCLLSHSLMLHSIPHNVKGKHIPDALCSVLSCLSRRLNCDCWWKGIFRSFQRCSIGFQSGLCLAAPLLCCLGCVFRGIVLSLAEHSAQCEVLSALDQVLSKDIFALCNVQFSLNPDRSPCCWKTPSQPDGVTTVAVDRWWVVARFLQTRCLELRPHSSISISSTHCFSQSESSLPIRSSFYPPLLKRGLHLAHTAQGAGKLWWWLLDLWISATATLNAWLLQTLLVKNNGGCSPSTSTQSCCLPQSSSSLDRCVSFQKIFN